MRLNPVANAFFIALAVVGVCFDLVGLFYIVALLYLALCWLWERLPSLNPIAAMRRWLDSTDW
jgi:hypothetical protein